MQFVYLYRVMSINDFVRNIHFLILSEPVLLIFYLTYYRCKASRSKPRCEATLR